MDPVSLIDEAESIVPDRTSSLEVIKDNLVLIATVAATLYALGWISETLMYKHFGMGDVGITHEHAIAAGVATLVCLSPFFGSVAFGMVARKSTSTPMKFRTYSLLAALFATGLLYIMHDGHFVDLQHLFYPNRSFYTSLEADAFLGAVGAFLVFSYVYTKRQVDIEWRALFGVGAFVLKWVIFSNHVLPCLSHGLGGFTDQDVLIGLKSDSDLCAKDQPCHAQAFLLAQDNECVLAVQGFHINQFKVNAPGSEEDADTTIEPMDGRPIRIATSEILWMKQPEQALKVFRNTE